MKTNRLEALKAALEAKREALDALISFEDTAEFREAQRTWAECPKHDALRDAYLSKRTAFYALTDDTIAALIAVAEAAAQPLWRQKPVELLVRQWLNQVDAALAPLLEDAMRPSPISEGERT